MKTIKLKTIKEEKADCIAAMKEAGAEVGDLVVFCHHQAPIERLALGYRWRTAYITERKRVDEQALRFRMFRPLKDHPILRKSAELRKMVEEYDALSRAKKNDYPGMSLAERMNNYVRANFKKFYGVDWERLHPSGVYDTSGIFGTFPFQNKK